MKDDEKNLDNKPKETLKAEDLLKELEDILDDVFKPRENDFKVVPTEHEKVEPNKEETVEEEPQDETEEVPPVEEIEVEEKPKKKKSKVKKSKKDKPKLEKIDVVDEPIKPEEIEIIEDEIFDDVFIQDEPKVKKTKVKKTKVKKTKTKRPKKLETFDEILEIELEEIEVTDEPKKQKKKKSKFFRVFVLVLILILTRMCFFGWDKIEEFLNYYEQSIPEVVMDEVVLSLNQGEYQNLISYASFDVNEFESIDDVVRNVMLDIPAHYEYVKDTAKINNYYLIRDSVKIGEVSLKTTDLTNEFELPSYEINSVVVDLNLINEIQLIVPHNSTITINGVPAQDGDYLVETNEILNISNKYIAYEDVITVGGFMIEPEILVYYNDVELTSDTGEYIVQLDESKYDYISKLALDVAKKYANFTSNDLSLEDIENYFDKTTDTYNKIKTYNGIYYNSHSSYAFEYVLIGEISMVNDNIIKANVSFNYVIVSWNGRYDYPSDYTIYFDSSNNKVISLGMN